MRTAAVFLSTSLVFAAAAHPAAAQQARNFSVCGGNAFNTCASVDLTVGPANSSGLSAVQMRVWNLSGFNGTYGASIFTKIGFFNTGGAATAIPSSLVFSGTARAGDAPNPWQLADPNNAGGVSLELVTSANGNSSAVDNGIASGCDPANLPGGSNDLWLNPCRANTLPTLADAGWVSMNFDIQGQWNLQTTELLIQAQNGPGGASSQCITGQNCSVVPEPGTTVLLATGLLGLGTAYRRRRLAADEEALD